MIILSEDKNIMSLLSEHDAHQVLLALFSEPDDIPELSPLANMAYTAVKSKSDRISERKSKAGKLGGSAHKDQSAKEQAEASRTSRNKQNKQNKQKGEKQATVPYPYPLPIPIPIPPLPPKGENTRGILSAKRDFQSRWKIKYLNGCNTRKSEKRTTRKPG